MVRTRPHKAATRKKKRREPARRCGPELQPHQVVLRPIITEKGTAQAEHHNTYTFRVHPSASKEVIRRAVEELFEVTVLTVRTQNRKGKTRRYRKNVGKTADWKKAIVQLSEKDRIALF